MMDEEASRSPFIVTDQSAMIATGMAAVATPSQA